MWRSAGLRRGSPCSRSGASPSTRCCGRSSPGRARRPAPGCTSDSVLTWLVIQGLALVDRLEMTLDPALNVLTGETGAGKSLIVGSIALLLGERADPEWLRDGTERGFVEGVFDLSGRPDLLEAVRALDLEVEEDRVIVRR